MVTDKVCLKKKKQKPKNPPNSFQQELIRSRLCLYKTGQLVGVARFWGKRSLGCFSSALLLICSLSPSDNTLRANTHENVLEDLAILISSHTKHYGVLIYHYLVSFIVLLSYMNDKDGQDQGKGAKERNEAICGEA